MDDKLPPVERTVGADPGPGYVFLLDKKRNVVTLDLETRRLRPSLEQVRHAAVGPDGALYVVDSGKTVTQLVRRTPVRFRQKLQGAPRELHGTMGGMLVAMLAGDEPRVEVLGADRPPATFEVPKGAQSLTFWGDLVAVAADTAVVIYETEGDGDGKREHITIPVSGDAKAVMFSPSGPPDLRRESRRGTAGAGPGERRGAGGDRSPRARHRTHRRSLRPVGAGAAGLGRFGLGRRRGQERLRRHRRCGVGQRPARGHLAQHAAHPAGQGRRRASISPARGSR